MRRSIRFPSSRRCNCSGRNKTSLDAATAAAVLFVIVLVIIFGAPERLGGLDFGRDRAAETAGFLKTRAYRLRGGCLLRRQGENRRTVLVAHIRTLAIKLRRVVQIEKPLDQ